MSHILTARDAHPLHRESSAPEYARCHRLRPAHSHRSSLNVSEKGDISINTNHKLAVYILTNVG